MSENVRMYLSGGMSSLSFEEQTKWRKQVKNTILLFKDYDLVKNPIFFDPTEHYNFEVQEHKTEKEPFEYDLYQLRNSDLVIVNFNDPNSIGTAVELALAYEYRKPIVGLNEDGKELHPWLLEMTMRMCTDVEELCHYVMDFFLKN